MKVKISNLQRERSHERSDYSDTCESLPRQPPPKIAQKRIKHNFQKLTAVPKVMYAGNIKQLYLSHNNLHSLQGIQLYTGLTCLNISYNCLSKISELRLIINPHLLKRISLRMNQFQYGYEDYTVGLLSNLERLDDHLIEQAQVKEKMFKMRANLAAGIIKFTKKCQRIIDQFQEQTDKENNSIQTNIVPNNNKTQSKKNSYCYDHRLLYLLKDHYIQHHQRSLSAKSIKQLLTITSSIIDIVNSADIYVLSAGNQNYGKATNDVCKHICDQILMKFRQRHDNALINFLQKDINEGISYFTAFVRLGMIDQSNFKCQEQIPMAAGSIKHLNINNNPARYMQRMSPTQLHLHPINYLANWRQHQYSTLIPQHDTKWHNYYHSKNILPQQQQSIYEQVPIFIYCKEYLQVLAEIVLEKIGLIINLQNQHKVDTENKHSLKYQQAKNDDQIELHLSDSEMMSFGNRDENYQSAVQLFNINQDQQSLQAKKQPNTKISRRNLQKSIQQPSSYDLNKYSLYEINLTFKVLRGLKERVKKRKNSKKTKGTF